MSSLFTSSGLRLIGVSFAVGFGAGVLFWLYIAYTLVEQGVLK